MRMRSMFFLLSALVAEVVASGWLWARAPTDTLRVDYAGFWEYEVERLFRWAILFPVYLLIGLILWRLLFRAVRNKPERLNLFTAALALITALGLEISASVWYLRAPSSRPIRDLYGSIWYWHRVPQPGDQGWASFKGYIGDHALLWCIAFLIVEGVLWVALRKWATHLSSG
jgi:branched-subunit amino acid ABC-type transport system permease component